MILPLAKLLDWTAIQLLVRVHCRPGQNQRLAEALHFLKGPGFLPAESQPAPVEFNDPMHFCFPTPRPCDLPQNNVVYGRLYRCTERWRQRPVIVLLHGNGGDPDYHLRFPFIARHCNRVGFNAVTLGLPYHFQRRSRQFWAWSGLDYLGIAEALAQAVAEIRSLTGWLLGRGCPNVALWGYSLGAWLGGLAACRDARLASAVLAIPGVGFNISLADSVIWPGVRESLRGQRPAWEALNRTPFSLTRSQPAIAKENLLLIEGTRNLALGARTWHHLLGTASGPDGPRSTLACATAGAPFTRNQISIR